MCNMFFKASVQNDARSIVQQTDTISVLSSASDNPCFLTHCYTWGPEVLFRHSDCKDMLLPLFVEQLIENERLQLWDRQLM